MSEESTSPDPVELTRVFFETMDREWDFGSLAGFFASDAVWNLSDSHIGIYEGVAAIGDFLVGYWATWEDHHHALDLYRRRSRCAPPDARSHGWVLTLEGGFCETRSCAG